MAAQVATMLDREALDILEISGGNYEAGIFRESVRNAEVERCYTMVMCDH